MTDSSAVLATTDRAIPDAAIEAAADVVSAKRNVHTWSSSDIANAAIEAAMPAIREHIAQEIEAAHRDAPRCDYDVAARIVRGGDA